MHLTPKPTPSSRLPRADLLESSCNLTEQYKGLLYNLKTLVPNRKAVRPVKPFRGAWPGGVFLRAPVDLKTGGGQGPHRVL